MPNATEKLYMEKETRDIIMWSIEDKPSSVRFIFCTIDSLKT